jgi:hypothetical protein
MTNMIRRVTQAVKGNAGGAAVFVSRKAADLGRIFIDRLGSGESTQETLRTEKIVRVTGATHELTAEDDGAIVVIDYAAGSSVISLPATRKALRFSFIVNGLAGGGAGHSVSPVSADKIIGNGFTAADNKDAICSAASDRIGDALTLVGDGVDGYFIESVVGTWAREA